MSQARIFGLHTRHTLTVGLGVVLSLVLLLAPMAIQQAPAQAATSTGSMASALAPASAAETCPAVFAVGVAGTAEPGAPDGSMGRVSSNVLANMAAALPPAVSSHVKAVGLPYPAIDIIPGVTLPLIGGMSYLDSRDLGISNLIALLYSHANACPDQRFVLVGYSQGADVVATALASLDSQLNVARHVETHIAGVALFGDPRFDPFDDADGGSYSKSLSGIWNTFPTLPELNRAGTRPALTTYAGRLRTYCNQGDPICNFSAKNAVDCFGQKTWNLILGAATGGVTGAALATLTNMLDSGDYIKASCPHLRYIASKVKPPTANTAMAAATLANQVLAALYPITMGPTSLSDATATSYYQTYLDAAGGTGAYTWSATGLPSWLRLNSSSGLLSGTPPLNAGDATFTVNVTDGYRSATRSYTLHLLPSSCSSGACTISAWGDNAVGELGNGTTTGSPTPAEVANLSGVTAIAAGTQHSLALRTDGTVWQWGANFFNEPEDPTLFSKTSVQVSALSNVTAIADGSLHSLALRADGTVWAWGFNDFGQLGNGTTTSSSTPVQVNGLSGVTAIAAGNLHSLALRTDGTVWAWGYNYSGQLGNGTTTHSSAPVQVSGLSDVTAIAAGSAQGDHSLALRTDGSVWAWGDNYAGQLGNGTTTDSPTPVQVSGLSDVTAIAAGFNPSLALRTDGTVQAWGNNRAGQLGNGTTTIFPTPTPVQVNGLAGVTTIGGGGFFSLAVLTDGTMTAWGDNSQGALGDGTLTSTSTPVRVSGLSGVTAIAAGVSHSLALHK
jgi:alpha-tubulin suppressor-like RCC1 family protein